MNSAVPTPVLPDAAAPTIDPIVERRAVVKVMVRLIPFMCLLYLFNYLDRVNVAFAKFQMQADFTWLSEAAYGLGASLFFVGYCLFEVPSNLIMERVGARLWMARIMITWGLVSTAMMFVTEAWHFYTLRLLLGVAEAGFFPGMILYMTYWIPANLRARSAALFLTSTALSGVVGGPLSDLLLGMQGGGLRGWQWLFLIEGIPSVLLGLVIFFLLADKPRQARWLSAEEKDALEARLNAEQAGLAHAPHSLRHAMTDLRVWALSLLYAGVIFGFYIVNYWTPTLLKTTSLPAGVPLGVLSAIPFFAAAVTMSAIGLWADKTGHRRPAVIAFSLLGAVGFALAALISSTGSTLWMIVALSLAAAGMWSTLGPFWALPSRFLRGSAAAAGIGLINSFGNFFGGFVGPNMMGQIKQRYDSYTLGLWITCGISVGAAVIAWTMVKERESRRPRPHLDELLANLKPEHPHGEVYSDRPQGKEVL